MMSDDVDSSAALLYVRFRGRVQGPYSREQLKTQAARGKFTRLHEVSVDGQSWQRAAEYPELFGIVESAAKASKDAAYEVEEAPPVATPIAKPSQKAVPGSGAEAVWYYTSGPERRGPVDFAELRFFVSIGQLTGNDLVWKEGMADWITVSQVPSLAPPRPDAEAKSTSDRSGLEQPPRVSGLAVTSLVLGLLWIFGIGSLLAVVFGAVAIYQIRISRGQLFGTGLAVAGLVLGIVMLALQAVGWALAIYEVGRVPLDY